MTPTNYTPEPAMGKPEAMVGEIMTHVDAQHRASVVRGALQLLYSVGERTGQRRLCAAALAGLNAVRGTIQ